MKKQVLKRSAIILTIISVIILSGCNNNQKDFTYSIHFKNTHTYQDYLKIKDKVKDYADFGPYSDGVRWVRKDIKDFDTNEEQYGYIDMNGNLVVPLSSEWTSVHDFSDGVAFVHFKSKERLGDNTAIIDKNGTVIKTFNVNMNRKDMHNSFSEGYAIYEKDFGANQGSWCYIIDKNGNTKQITPKISFSKDSSRISDFEEGLCRIYSDVIPESGGKGSCTFINTDGEIQISMRDYWVKSSKDFENGQATLIIKGEDKEDYRVTIDKNGNILSTEKK